MVLPNFWNPLLSLIPSWRAALALVLECYGVGRFKMKLIQMLTWYDVNTASCKELICSCGSCGSVGVRLAAVHSEHSSLLPTKVLLFCLLQLELSVNN
jgi:hypothetical protein